MNFEYLGYIATALVVIAYIPQIVHLTTDKCAWGVSVASWYLWLAAGILLFVYALAQGDTVFMIIQTINIIAISTTIVLCLRDNTLCPRHVEHLTKKNSRVS